MLNLYSIFHLNLAYSSIPEEKRKEVIDRCFWPLLQLATDGKIPIAIEAPGYTLEVVQELDPQWVSELKKAISQKTIEFIGAGYSQLIAPIVPNLVNVWNLDIGKQIYERLLGLTPMVWFVNEQAYSKGIIEHYVRVGARGIIMEWNNPRTLHPEWDGECRYYPQIAVGTGSNRISVLWNDSITFQKFQRYAHDDIGFEELQDYLLGHMGDKDRYFCLYGNDAEIFDFRPGRFQTEPRLEEGREWMRIRELYDRLLTDTRFNLVFPSDVFEKVSSLSGVPSWKQLFLESAVQPIPVKKQPKYNVTRWAVTGRDSTRVNTTCYQIYHEILTLMDEELLTGTEMYRLQKKLCYLWSSDFRTHIADDRWRAVNQEIEEILQELRSISGSSGVLNCKRESSIVMNGLHGSVYFGLKKEMISIDAPAFEIDKEIIDDGRFLRITTPAVDVVFNRCRGLAIDSLMFPRICPNPLLGTIRHGYFEDISLSADWYTGNTVLQRPGKPQITDLENTDPVMIHGKSDWGEWIGFVGTLMTDAGPICKRFIVYKDIPQIELDFAFDWKVIPMGSLRSCFLTLIPESFEQASLFYGTHNGGSDYEFFKTGNNAIAQGAPSSSVVTASTGLGATEGIIVVGDKSKGLAIFVDHTVCAAMPMVSFRAAHPSFFARMMFSLHEIDESRKEAVSGPLRFAASIVGLKRSIQN